MTWAGIAAEHQGHRCILTDERTLTCHTCDGRKLILPRDPGSPVATPTPRPYSRNDIPGRPMPEGWRQRLTAELAARKRERTTVTPPAEQVQ